MYDEGLLIVESIAVMQEEAGEEEYDADGYDEEEEEEPSVTVADLGEFVEPAFASSQIQLYVMLGSMIIASKIDMYNPVVVKVIRYVSTFDIFAFHCTVSQSNHCTLHSVSYSLLK